MSCTSTVGSYGVVHPDLVIVKTAGAGTKQMSKMHADFGDENTKNLKLYFAGPITYSASGGSFLRGSHLPLLTHGAYSFHMVPPSGANNMSAFHSVPAWCVK
eukprot:13209759-Alexandrium_andersonii.AAC.1